MHHKKYGVQRSRRSFAWFDDQLIMLDIKKNEYAILSPQQSREIAEKVDGDEHDRVSNIRKRKYAGVLSNCWSLKNDDISISNWRIVRRAICILSLVHRCSQNQRLAGLERLIEDRRSFINGSRRVGAGDLVKSLNGACLLYRKKTKCLEWSAALVVLGFEYGFDFTLVIGVQNRPFYAHAWVELDGEIVGDDPRLPDQLAIIHRIN
jgi:hypothetical protein